MPAGAISQLMGFIYNPDFKNLGNSPLLKFRIGVSRYDFSQKKTVMDFFTITAFGKSAQSIHSSISNGANYICCFCDVKVSKYLSKSGTPVEHVEFIIHDFRTFSVQKSSNQELATPQEYSPAQDQPTSQELSPAMNQPLPQDIPTENNLRDHHPIPPPDDQNGGSPRNSLFPNSFSSQQDPF
ncbi:MAG: hypothetical protein LBI47_02385 [Puniceicoccales bacterium]|jgi:single-stranded DNA-binding protein|nr:hypothetical protein [Puniceicoccales bacterium]